MARKPATKSRSKTKPEPVTKKPVGRPSAYKPEYAEQARKLCLLGATDKDMADFFGVSEQTVNAWKKEFPEFLESLQAGKIKADAEVASRLYDRACGAEWTEEQAFKLKRGTNHEIVEVVTVRKAAPPDTPAIALWLGSRRPELWRKRTDAPVNTPTEIPEDYQQPLNPDEPLPDAPIL